MDTKRIVSRHYEYDRNHFMFSRDSGLQAHHFQKDNFNLWFGASVFAAFLVILATLAAMAYFN
jgi:hypothetical protein